MKKNLLELIRYGLVGALATLVDWAVLYVGTEYLFAPLNENAVYPAHVLSFLSGLIVNFILSNLFVFTADSQRGKGNNFKAKYRSGSAALRVWNEAASRRWVTSASALRPVSAQKLLVDWTKSD